MVFCTVKHKFRHITCILVHTKIQNNRTKAMSSRSAPNDKHPKSWTEKNNQQWTKQMGIYRAKYLNSRIFVVPRVNTNILIFFRSVPACKCTKSSMRIHFGKWKPLFLLDLFQNCRSNYNWDWDFAFQKLI